MTLNRSFSKLLRETMRRNIWATALSLVGFFFCLPLPAAMLLQNRMANQSPYFDRAEQLARAAEDMKILLGPDNAAVKLGMCIMAVLCGIALFSYLHSRQKVDFYHSLPLRRSELFAVHYVSGVLMVLPAFLIMYVLAALVGMVMGVPMDAAGSITGSEIVYALLLHVIFFLFLYTISVLATVLTGSTILAVLLDFWMLFSVPAIGLIGQALGSEYLNNWAGSSVLDWICYNTSPVVLYFSMSIDGDFWNCYQYTTLSKAAFTLIAVLVLTVLLAVLCRALFARRKSERSGMALAFEGIKLPIKCYMVLLIAMIFGLVFYGLGGSVWLWFGLAAGTVLGHVVIEMIYHFDFRAAFAHWKTMIVLAVAAVAIVLGAQNDIMGYDTWLPREDEVSAVGFGTGLGYAKSENSSGLWDVEGSVRWNDGRRQKGELLTDPKNIAAIRKLSEIGIQCGKEGNVPRVDSDGRQQYYGMNVTYRLKNGRVESRSYSIPDNEEVWALVDAIRFTEDYQRKANPLFSRVESDAEDKTLTLAVRTNEETSSHSGYLIDDPDKVRTIVETLREETLTLTGKTAAAVPVLRMDIRTLVQDGNSKHVSTICEYVPVSPTFTRTLALLAAEGVQPKALTADALESITIRWDEEGAEKWMQEYEVPVATVDMDYPSDQAGMVSVKDKAMLAKLLENAVICPVAYSCDISTNLVSRDRNNDSFNLMACFPNGATETLFYPRGQFPTALCEALVAAGRQTAQ